MGLAQGLHAPVNTRMGDFYGVAREYIWNRENIYGRQREYIWNRENVYGTYMEHRPLLTAGQEMDHWTRPHDGGTVMIVVETTMLQF